MWKPQHYVRTWLAKDRRDATSLKGMARDAKIQDDASQETLCTLWEIMSAMAKVLRGDVMTDVK